MSGRPWAQVREDRLSRMTPDERERFEVQADAHREAFDAALQSSTATVAKVHDCPDCTHAKPEPAPLPPCEWFSWMGGSCCERCGGSLDKHRGIEWISPDGGPFDIDGPTVQVEWKDYGPGRVLNVPLLTLYMPEGALEYLQTMHAKASGTAGDERG